MGVAEIATLEVKLFSVGNTLYLTNRTDMTGVMRKLQNEVKEHDDFTRRSIISGYRDRYVFEKGKAVVNGTRFDPLYLPMLDLMLTVKQQHPQPEEFVGAAMYRLQRALGTVLLPEGHLSVDLREGVHGPLLSDVDRHELAQQWYVRSPVAKVYARMRPSADRIAKTMKKALDREFPYAKSLESTVPIDVLKTAFRHVFGRKYSEWEAALARQEFIGVLDAIARRQ